MDILSVQNSASYFALASNQACRMDWRYLRSQTGHCTEENADGWTVGELNTILENNLVPGSKGHLCTFGCIEWESELFNGRPKSRCYPFDLPKHRFRGQNPQVQYFSILNSYTNSYMNPGLCMLGRPETLQPQRPRDF